MQFLDFSPRMTLGMTHHTHMTLTRGDRVSGWVGGRGRSFAYAFRGLLVLLKEPNAQIHLVATVAVVTAGLYFRLPKSDWFLVIAAIAGVWVTEALNTALEALANAAVPNVHPLVRNAKDVAAGAVLLAALGAAAIGGLVFVPHLHQLMH